MQEFPLFHLQTAVNKKINKIIQIFLYSVVAMRTIRIQLKLIKLATYILFNYHPAIKQKCRSFFHKTKFLYLLIESCNLKSTRASYVKIEIRFLR